MQRTFGLLLLIPLLLGVPGCLSTAPPLVTVESIELVGVDDEAMSLSLNGTVSNPHQSETRLLQFEYVLSIDGQAVYRGRHAAEMTLTSGVSRDFSLPAAFPYTKAGWTPGRLPGESPWKMSGSLLYLGEGVLAETLLDLGYRPSVSYAASGELVLAPSN